MPTTTDTITSRSTTPKVFETSGEIFEDGRFLELVNTSTCSTSLLYWDGRQSHIAQQHDIGDCRYIAAPSAASLDFLPSGPKPYGTTEELFTQLSQFLAETLVLPKDELSLLVCFCFASYFCDCLDLTPCLLLQGPSAVDAIAVLQALASVCRHPLMLAKSAISALTNQVNPTRFVCQPDAEFEKMLPAILFPQFGFVNSGIRHLRGACSVYIGDEDLQSNFAKLCLSIAIPPQCSRGQGELQLERARTLRNELLMYRLRNFSLVKGDKCEITALQGSIKELGYTLGRCIVEAPRLREQLVTWLSSRDRTQQIEAGSSLAAVVFEALVALCHQRKLHVHVGQVASMANTILSVRDEYTTLSPKQVGTILRHQGLRTSRLDKGGRGIYLLGPECALIHDRARAYGVPGLREGLSGCPHCHPKDVRDACDAHNEPNS